jgi:hypothetical protein
MIIEGFIEKNRLMIGRAPKIRSSLPSILIFISDRAAILTILGVPLQSPPGEEQSLAISIPSPLIVWHDHRFVIPDSSGIYRIGQPLI